MSSLMYFTKGVVLEYHKRKVDLTNPWSFLVHIIHNIVVKGTFIIEIQIENRLSVMYIVYIN